MNLDIILDQISRRLMSNAIADNQVAAALREVALQFSIHQEQLTDHLIFLADGNRDHIDPVWIGYAKMAYINSHSFNELHDKYSLGQTAHLLGVMLNIKGQSLQAKDKFEEAMGVFEGLKDAHSVSVAKGDCGSALFHLGQYNEALKYQMEAYEASMNYDSIPNRIEWSRGLGYSFNSIGDYKNALHYAQIALDLERQLGRSTNSIMTIFSNVYENMGRYEEALRVCYDTLDESIEENNLHNLMEDHLSIARLLGRLNRPKDAIKHWRKGEEIAKQLDKDHGIIRAGLALINYSQIINPVDYLYDLLLLATKNGLADARNDIMGALAQVTDDLDEAVGILHQSIEEARERNDTTSVIYDLLSLARLYEKTNDLDNELNTTNELMSISTSVLDDGLKHKMYMAHYQCLNRIGVDLDQSRGFIVKAVECLDTFALSIKDDADKLKFFEDKRSVYQYYVEHKIKEGDQLLALDACEEVKSKILRSSISNDNSIDNIKDRMDLLDEKELFLSFFAIDEEMIVFACLNGIIRQHTLPVNKERLGLWNNRWSEYLVSGENGISILREIGLELVAPVLEQYKSAFTSIIISRDFILNVPVHACILSDNRYLIEEFDIHYIPSLFMLSEDTQKGNSNLLILSHEGLDNVGLMYATKESKEVNEIMPSTWLSNDATTGEIIESKLHEHDSIHLACHSSYLKHSPEYSYYVLEDYLNADKISRMDLKHINLVFSASCQSATSQSAGFTEYFGLTRGWLLAGVKNYIGSLWNLNDEFSYELTKEFYQRLTKQVSKKAYRSAILSLMTNKKFSEPKYWAGIVLIRG